MNKRDTQILEILSQQKKITIKNLAEAIGVSRVTVCKDLDRLEERGIIERSHGYAMLNKHEVSQHISHNYHVKTKIVKHAAAEIKEGDTVMLGYGPCTTLLAEELIMAKKKVTIITYSIYLAQFVQHLPDSNVILLGGFFMPGSQVLVGQLTVDTCKAFRPDKFFIEVNGFLPDSGFTGYDHFRVQTDKDLINHSKDVFVLVESHQFNQNGVFVVAPFDHLTGVYTDDGIPENAEEILKKNNVALSKVSINENT